MLNIIQRGLNFDSWKKLKNELLEIIENEYSSIPSAKQLSLLLSADDIKLSVASAFHYFHYLYGFWFKSETTGKTPNELKTIMNDLTSDTNILIISVNASYNTPIRNSHYS